MTSPAAMRELEENAVTVPSSEISSLAEHLFRHEAGKLVSILTGIFGTERLQLAEDVVQEALIRALRTWPYYGIPEKPAAWLTQTARNLALDVIRRETLFREKQTQIIASVEQWSDEARPDAAATFDHEIRDDRLRLMFACCHPALPQEAQVALALKTLCGFSPAEIARAFLTTEAAIAKRLTRARQRIRELRLPFAIPSGGELGPRLDAVLQTVYLLFNEGYKASSGDRLIRDELCREAIRLCELLAAHPAGDQPRVHALLALMLFNAARLPGRVDARGNLLRLKEQDRNCWDTALVARGMRHFAASASGEELSEYHLQAGIAACHCAAPDYDSTDWRRILFLYDRWMMVNDSPLIALNRAVAVAQVAGPRAGLDALVLVRKRRELAGYYLLHAVLGDLEERLGNAAAATGHFEKAMQLAELESEKEFLRLRLEACGEAAEKTA